MTPLSIEIVVARADNGIIGANGTLPWRLPKDLRHFKLRTMGAPMIMGRRTFESLPRRLPDRRHIVLTQDGAWWAPDVDIAYSIEEALDLVREEGAKRVSIIGGAEIYRQFLPMTDKIHMTEVHIRPEGDTVFPDLNRYEWVELRGPREPAEGSYPSYTFVDLLRRASLSRE